VQHALFSDVSQTRDQSSSDGTDFVPRVATNGLRSWPTVEDYAKLKRKAREPHHRTRPKQVILHVGTWKTGTKALQKFFALNRRELERQGIHYPLTPGAPYMEGLNQTYQNRVGTSGGTDRHQRLLALAKDVHASACDTCLISHENICNLARPELLEFVSCFSGCAIRVVLYLRRQDSYAESLYNQHVKAGATFPGTFDEHFARYRERYDYRRMILKLAALFGEQHILVRPYEQEQFHGGTIFADFMHHVLGQEVAGRYLLPERDQNARLDRDALEFKRIINGLDGAKQEKLQIGKLLIRYCEEADPRIREAFQPHALLSPEQRIQLLQGFAEDNAWIARTCLGRADGALFLEPWPRRDDAWTPYPGLSANKAAELAIFLYRATQREAEQVAATRGGPQRLQRAVKRLCKRSFRQAWALASRLRPGGKPKPEPSARPSAALKES
jgi:hypothetical protein